MKCTNCGRAIYPANWHDSRGDAHTGYIHLQTNRDQCLLPGRILFAAVGK